MGGDIQSHPAGEGFWSLYLVGVVTLSLINADSPEALLRSALRVSNQFDAYWVAAEHDGALSVTLVEGGSSRQLKLVGLPSKLGTPSRPRPPADTGLQELASAIKNETGYPTTYAISLGSALPWSSVLGSCQCHPGLNLGQNGAELVDLAALLRGNLQKARLRRLNEALTTTARISDNWAIGENNFVIAGSQHGWGTIEKLAGRELLDVKSKFLPVPICLQAIRQWGTPVPVEGTMTATAESFPDLFLPDLLTFFFATEASPLLDLRKLSDAEQSIVRMIWSGASNKEIAQSRGRSLKTVENQIHALYPKLGVRDRRELILRAASPRPEPVARPAALPLAAAPELPCKAGELAY